jgi:4-diphosphocytidyl-2-C-methyl-D-erythritol kinase
MSFIKLKSWAKINLSLNLIKRLSNNYHSIESLITFVQIFDEIKIKTLNKKEHKISFSGKFSKGIGKRNTVYKLLKLLEKKKIINKKFEINIKKNIPQKSGMGGGSMNAASILSYFMKKRILNISNKKAKDLAYKVGSDVVLGLEKKNSILFKNKKIGRLNKKIDFHVLIVMANEGCSTKYIFSKVKKYSKPLYFNINKRFFETNYLVQSNNDLENVVFKKYSKIKNLKYFLSNLPNIVFTRMTGSGSAIVAYFKSKKAANNAARIFRRKYKNYWYIVSKTI